MTSVTVIRHPKERISKCSLKSLHDESWIEFYKANEGFSFDATGYILLALDAPVLSAKDEGHPLLLLDSTWRLLPQVQECVQGEPIYRTLPEGVETAYPRVSKISEDPMGGLASIEALYLALKILGEDKPELLSDYYWKDDFLKNLQKVGL